ncbi:MAG TPA: recombinase family protein, partial [Lacipirellulaceae bacterium]|nr:recombinase family protein [Lacipirellulaceae bacterium]
GYDHVPMRNEAGEIVLKPNGRARRVRAFDPVRKELALRMWRMFYEEKLTPNRIALIFNRERVDGWDGWRENVVRRMLLNPAYIGLFIWNRTRTAKDWETGRTQKVPNRWQDWQCVYHPELALVPKAWHVYARNTLEKSTKLRGTRSRPRRTPATLFSELLICGCCKRPIKLFRSRGECKSMACLEGMLGRYGCTMRSCKSVKIIEESLLRFIRDGLLTPERLEALVVRCNEQLAKEAARPRADLAPLRKQQETLQREIGRLVDRIAAVDDDGVVKAVRDAIAERQRTLEEVRRRLAAASRDNVPPPPPLDLARVQVYLQDLRGLLNQQTPAAAEALRALVGPIVITDQPYADGRRGAHWFATFQPDFLTLLGKEAQRRQYPDSAALGFLLCRKWTPADSVTVELKGREFSDSRLSEQTYHTLHELIRTQPALPNKEIARRAGCGEGTVWRHRRRVAGE